jgi:TetR/AcrR family transcriptional regulator
MMKPRPNRNPKTGSTRDPERTQARILAAAVREFSANGLTGARVDAIARGARVNKRMLYHYFGSKRGLFAEVLRHKLTEREEILASAPEDAAAALGYWFDAACRDRDWIRLLEWEALQGTERPLVHEARRRAAARKAIAQTRRRQSGGFLDAGLDARHLLLSLVALTAYPMAFPQVTRLVTGRSATDPVFQRERRDFLKHFAAMLQRGAPP